MSVDVKQWNPNGAIIHIGAGAGAAVRSYARSGAKRIVLVEPDPDKRFALEGMARQDDRITVFPHAIGPKVGETTFTVYNYSGLNSIDGSLTRVNSLPGLKAQDQHAVMTTSLSALLKSLKLSRAKRNILVYQALGQENSIQQLIDFPEIQHLVLPQASERIADLLGKKSLGEFSAPHEAGFRLYRLTMMGGRYTYYCVRDSRAGKLSELNRIKEELHAQSKQIEVLRQEAERAERLSEELSQAGRQLQKTRDELEEYKDRLGATSREVERLTSLETRAKCADDLATALQRLKRRFESSSKELRENQQERDLLNKQLDELRAENLRLRKFSQVVKDRQDKLEQELGRAETQIRMILENIPSSKVLFSLPNER